MNERVVQLVQALMRAFPPDMERTYEGSVEKDNGAHDYCRALCYSTTQLVAMLGDDELVYALCKANEGESLWPSSVRNFLLGWLS